MSTGKLGTDSIWSTDVPAAEAFYGALAGWKFTGEGFRQALHNDNVEAAFVPMEPEHGWTTWLISVAVPDARSATAKAAELGAQVDMAPTEIPGAGLVASLRDPGGAPFAIYTPPEFDDSDSSYDVSVGRIVWHELKSNDVERARGFYTSVFGWTNSEMEGKHGPYTLFHRNGQPFAGAYNAPDPGARPGWTIFVEVANVDDAVARVPSLGGSVLEKPYSIPTVGRLAYVKDPAGGEFALITSESRAG